jgi:hypothetical protein
MQEKIINQFGDKPLYIERNQGNVYLANNYTRDSASAFARGSDELLGYTPAICPEIPRQEVDLIQEWIESKSDTTDGSARLALLYGKAGIGKSIVMHKLLEHLQGREDYLVLGIKSDLVEFANMDDLRGKLYLTRPIEDVIREEASKRKRVVLLVDQIDALSLSLSANRSPLRSLLNLIRRLANIPHVRVVISCRPYDLEYDPQLQNMKIKNRWELKELSEEQVLQTLRSNGHNESMDDRLISFLGNPLHLYLFLKVRPEERLTDPLSTNLLYHQLWSKYINNTSICPVSKASLLSLLDTLVDTMYQRQELSIHIREFETQYEQELRYLLTNDLLIESRNRQIQFFHQTLFDYVYARRFLEKGKSLLDELKERHQGLFIRAAVKSILMFLREQKPKEYLCTLDQLLYSQDDNGLSTFRFHLKSLALQTLANFETPLRSELDFISRKIYPNSVYMELVFNSVYTLNWFHAIWEIIDNKGGWQELSKAYRELAITMCRRVLWRDVDSVLDRLSTELNFDDEEDRKHLENVLNFYELDYSGDKFVKLYSKLVEGRNPLQYINLLNSSIQGNPTFVCDELKENIRLQLQENKETFFPKISVSYHVGELYKKLLKKHYSLAINFLFDVLTLIYETTSYEIGEAEDNIHHSYSFWSFHRRIKGGFDYDFVGDVTNILIDTLLEHIDDKETSQYLLQLSRSRYGGFVFIALYIYTSHPEVFKDNLCELICQREVLANAPSWVEYQAVEALKASFVHIDEMQKRSIIDRILTIHDQSEYRLDKEKVEWCRKFGHPFLDIDLHRGIALKSIPLTELRRISWKAYQERQRIERKFHPKRLENCQPSRISTRLGDPSLTQEQGQKMSPKAWLNSMRKYVNERESANWEAPSLRGQCILFQGVVSQAPDKFTDLIKQIAYDELIPLAYAQAGLEGLIQAGRIDDAVCVLEHMLIAVNHDINSDHRGFRILALLFALNNIVKQDHIPKLVVQLLCQTLLEAKESKLEEYQKDEDAITIGINQPRGQAGHLLVRCAREDSEYKEDIFRAIEAVAGAASVYTRAAILAEMAYLNFLDQHRNVRLFKNLMCDYNPRLMALPIHNYNPLVYFVNYALEELMEFFRHAVECPSCYPQQIISLFLAWSHNNRDERIKEMLDTMCNASQEARLSLLGFLASVEQNINEDILSYILSLMKPEFYSPELAEVFDRMFYHIDQWPQEYQEKIIGTYMNTLFFRYETRGLIHFLAGYAIKYPEQTLRWLEKILEIPPSSKAYVWNQIIEVIIQAYNGIKAFNQPDYQDALEYAMDLIDMIMQHPSNRYMISDFMNKLDNE